MTITQQRASDDWSEARTISLLAAHLPNELRTHVLDRARHLEDPGRACGR